MAKGQPGNSACLPPPTLTLPSRDCVGGQWVRRCCAKSRTLGKLRQQPRLEQGICFPVGCTQQGHPSLPLPPMLFRVLPREAYTRQELPYGFLLGSLPSTASIGLSCQRAEAELTWLITAATAWHTLSDITKYGNTVFLTLVVPGPMTPY